MFQMNLWQDPSVMDIACAALNGLKMGDRTLTVRRASASGQPKPDQANVLVQAQHQIALQRFALSAGGANAMSLGSMGMGVPGLLSGMGVGMMPNILSGMDVMPRMEELTRVVCLSQVCFCNTTITGTFLLIEINRTRSTCEKSICPVCYAGCLSR